MRLVKVFLLLLLCVPTFAQQVAEPDYNLSADYKKYNNIKKAGMLLSLTF